MAGKSDSIDEGRPAEIQRRSKSSWQRWLVFALLVIAIVALSFSGVADQAWTRLKENQDWLQAQVNEHYVLAILVAFAGYVMATGLSLPVATILSLAIGALFGRWAGTVLVSFAATAGATLAMLGSRYLLRESIQQRFGPRLELINQGMAKDGAFYLLTLRLLPIIPFWLVNLAIGLTNIRVRTFWLVSQVGMLPATFVYVNAGTALGELNSWRNVLSTNVIVSLLLLALLPLALKGLVWIVRKYRLRRSGT
jgi:uncharacterized membrane protein YdjX (TVP38/TMEM64 family)